MISQRDGSNGMKQPSLIQHNLANKRQSRDVNRVWVHFYTSLNHGELCLVLFSCLHKLEMKKYACYKFVCPQHNNANRGTYPPSFIAFNEVDGMKVHFRDLGKTQLRLYEILIKDSIWKGGVVSFFNEVDILKRTILMTPGFICMHIFERHVVSGCI